MRVLFETVFYIRYPCFEYGLLSAVIPAPVTEPTPAKAAISPDKEIMAGGAVFSYYGELDKDGNLDVVKCDQDGNKLSQSTLYLK